MPKARGGRRPQEGVVCCSRIMYEEVRVEPSGKRGTLSRGKLTWLLLLSVATSTAANKLASFSGTLKTFQRHACQGSNLSLHCPLNTTIDILHANYGSALPLHCPPFNGSQGGQCEPPEAIKHKTIKRVTDLCHRKRKCDLFVPGSSSKEEGKACPYGSQYIEVVFKCRPDIFIKKLLCEEDRITLNCGPESRIAIYESFFGRTKEGSQLCPQREGLPEGDCEATSVTEIVMKDCHGSNTCSIHASSSVFGRPCPLGYHLYMKTVYTCVPIWILRPSTIIRSDPEAKVGKRPKKFPNALAAEPSPKSTPKYFNRTLDRKPYRKFNDSIRSRITTQDLINCTVTILSGVPSREMGILTEWMRAAAFINKYFEKFLLYIVIGLIVGILLCLMVVTLRLLYERRLLRLISKEQNNFVAELESTDGDVDILASSASERGRFTLERGHSTAERGGFTLERGHSTAERGGFTLERGHSTAERGGFTLERGHSTAERGGFSSERGRSSSERERSISERVGYSIAPAEAARNGSSSLMRTNPIGSHRLGTRYNDADVVTPRSLSLENDHYFYS